MERRLDALEEFWDSEAPRIGEASARAERYWNASPLDDVSTLNQPRKPAPIPTDRDPYRHWAASETLCDRAYQLPTRSFDEAAELDPYATILFSDIRPLLVDLRSTEARSALRRVWLAFLGMHVPGYLSTLTPTPQDCTDDRWAYAHLASPSHLSSLMPSDADNAARRITADAQAGVLIGREREYSSAFGPVKHWGYGVIDPLESIPGTRWTMWGPEDVADVDVGLVREVFTQCRTGDNIDWDILFLAFEGACNLKAYVPCDLVMSDCLTTYSELQCIRRNFLPPHKIPYHSGLRMRDCSVFEDVWMMRERSIRPFSHPPSRIPSLIANYGGTGQRWSGLQAGLTLPRK